MKISKDDFDNLVGNLDQYGDPLGLKFYPFCIGWYNNKVDPRFHLDYDSDTLAFCVISTPKFFENSFLSYVKNMTKSVNDPFDQCMISTFKNLKEFLKEEIDVIHDFELNSKRRPKMLVQTAGHVSGAAFYYQKKDVLENPWGSKKIFGVSCHPWYGGWFGFRGSLIFKNSLTSFLTYKEPEDLLSVEQKIQLLDRFNHSWKDWTFRDAYNMSGERYSKFQQEYFQCKPSDRYLLLENFFEQKDETL